MVLCVIPIESLSFATLLLAMETLTQSKLRNPNAQSFTHTELQKALLETIASINQFGEEAGVNEVRFAEARMASI
jgi:hypothetical protein